MKDIRFLSLLLALCWVLPVAADEVKIGFVNIQRIVRDAPAAIKAARKLDQEFGRRDAELQALAKDVQGRQEALRSKSLADSVRAQKEKELAELSRDFQRKSELFQEDLNLRQNEENAALIERANNAIRQIAKSENFDVILQDAVAVGDRIDITDKVIKALSDDVR
ncbi:MAG: outer rane chaperone Skp (OmpH) [Proteobacteria bacterium]|nr:outer rane chaperone Skp (OmpH) [Pseudomonadota bacterium]